MKQLASLLPRNEQIKRAAFASQFAQEARRFLAIYTIFTPEQQRQLVQEDVRTRFSDVDQQLVDTLYAQTGGLDDSLSRLLYIDARMNLSDDLLLFNDKMSMANSLEMRVPYLDIELVAFLESLPSHMKIRGRSGKWIHKQAVRKWLPDEIIFRKKRGFATPMDQWLQTDLARTAQAFFNRPESAASKFFNLEFVNRIIADHQSRRHNYQRHIFLLLSFELWYQTFFERRQIDSALLYDCGAR